MDELDELWIGKVCPGIPKTIVFMVFTGKNIVFLRILDNNNGSTILLMVLDVSEVWSSPNISKHLVVSASVREFLSKTQTVFTTTAQHKMSQMVWPS